MNAEINEAVQVYMEKQFEYEQFLASIRVFFEKHPNLNRHPSPIIHSLKSRLKDPTHLADKLERKLFKGQIITKENILTEITDFIGVRVLHLHQDQFSAIHTAIREKVDNGDWLFLEEPKAYTWDPESVQFYQSQSIKTEVRDTFYTSIHYLVKPNNKNPICCEIQVRTLFEEIWGEIDHNINYPHKTDSIACTEQLRVLSKLVSTGTRLADSIFRTHTDYNKQKIPVTLDKLPNDGNQSVS